MQHQAVKSIDKDTGSNGIIMKDVEVKSMGLYFSILKRTHRPLPRRRPRPPTRLRHPPLQTTKTEAITTRSSTNTIPISFLTNCSSKMYSREEFHREKKTKFQFGRQVFIAFHFEEIVKAVVIISIYILAKFRG